MAITGHYAEYLPMTRDISDVAPGEYFFFDGDVYLKIFNMEEEVFSAVPLADTFEVQEFNSPEMVAILHPSCVTDPCTTNAKVCYKTSML